MSLFFALGKSAAANELKKSAAPSPAVVRGFFGHLGDIGDIVTRGLKPLARAGGRTVRKGLTTPGTIGLTAAGLGLGASASNELVGALASRTGLNIPHFFNSNKDQPLWAPHQTPYLIDLKNQGWAGVGHALSRPIQTAQHLLGYSPKPNPLSMLKSWDPWTQTLRYGPEDLASGDLQVLPGKKLVAKPNALAPVFRKMVEDHAARAKYLKDRNLIGGSISRANETRDPDQPYNLTMSDFPMNY